MVCTDAVLPIHPRSAAIACAKQQGAFCRELACPTDATTPKKKKPQSVGFAENLATIVVEADHPENPESIWYSRKELRALRSSAKAMADRIRLRQPSLVEEITEAYEIAKLNAHGGQQQPRGRGRQLTQVTTDPVIAIGSTKLYNKWSKLGSSRRGLERWVFPKQDRGMRAEEVRASRSIVLNVQCLLQRGGAVDQEEMLRQQYVTLAQPALIVAQQMAQSDEAAAMKYYKDDDKELDEDDEESLSPLSSASCASSVCSKASLRSRSGKKRPTRRR